MSPEKGINPRGEIGRTVLLAPAGGDGFARPGGTTIRGDVRLHLEDPVDLTREVDPRGHPLWSSVIPPE